VSFGWHCNSTMDRIKRPVCQHSKTAAFIAFRDAVHRLHRGVLYVRNVARCHGTPVHAASCMPTTEGHYCGQTSYTERHPNSTTDLQRSDSSSFMLSLRPFARHSQLVNGIKWRYVASHFAEIGAKNMGSARRNSSYP
jgi:hypothetical protein